MNSVHFHFQCKMYRTCLISTTCSSSPLAFKEYWLRKLVMNCSSCQQRVLVTDLLLCWTPTNCNSYFTYDATQGLNYCSLVPRQDVDCLLFASPLLSSFLRACYLNHIYLRFHFQYCTAQVTIPTSNCQASHLFKWWNTAIGNCHLSTRCSDSSKTCSTLCLSGVVCSCVELRMGLRIDLEGMSYQL